MEAWEWFLTEHKAPRNSIRRLIEDSWRRSVGQGVDPFRGAAPLMQREEDLQGLHRRNRELASAAKPIAAQAKRFLAESGTIMVITDPGGVIMHTEGDAATRGAAREIHLAPGGDWSEASVGTNAIGTALAVRGPVQIHAAEHFCEGIKQWTCSATVIEDPFDGEVRGIVDISGLKSTFDPHCLALAVATAGRITECLRQASLERRARLLEATVGRFYGRQSDALMVFDHQGRIVKANEEASSALRARGVELHEGGPLVVLRDNHLVDLEGQRLDSFDEDRVVPVVEGGDRLGTLLVLPVARQTGGSAAPRQQRQPSSPFEGILRASPSLATQVEKAERLADLPAPVLLQGETGVGKEVFARAIHDSGQYSDKPFVALNCGSLQRDLLSTELFGYAEGAFTGARRGGMPGKLEAADGGTLFLDEIGEMPLDLQPHLLRVLQEGEFYRLGENRPRKVRFRLLAATNRDLRQEVSEERFRMDLFYRLSVVTLTLPPLRERRNDIAPLARTFADQIAESYGLAPKSLSEDLVRALERYDWPGNIRELHNAIEAMMLMSGDDTLGTEALPEEYRAQPGGACDDPSGSHSGLLKSGERDLIVEAIRSAGGNLTRATRSLGIAKSTLYLKLKRFGIDPNAYRTPSGSVHSAGQYGRG